MHHIDSSAYLVWLASYPKSGNTWLRLLLGAYYLDGTLQGFNDSLKVSANYASRGLIDDSLGFGVGDLSKEALHSYRIEAFEWLAKRGRLPRFIKTHDAFYTDMDERIAIPLSVTDRAIYLVRNPLDIVHSFSHHAGVALEEVTDWLNKDDFSIMEWTESITTQVPQQLFNWSMHLASWMEPREIPVLLIRYEDMLADTHKTMHRIIEFLDQGLVDIPKLNKSVESCHFKRMQALEAKGGFYEAPSADRPFFRAGQVGQGRDVLPKALTEAIIEKHGEAMRGLGYL